MGFKDRTSASWVSSDWEGGSAARGAVVTVALSLESATERSRFRGCEIHGRAIYAIR